MKLLTLCIAFLLIPSAAFGEGLLAGNYTCRVAGASYISDGRGSSVKYVSGRLTVDASDNVSLNSRAIFTVRNRKPRVETLAVTGKGTLSDYVESDGDASASISFAVKPAKKVIYRGKNLVGTISADLDLTSGPILDVKTVVAKVRTPIGVFGLVCAEL